MTDVRLTATNPEDSSVVPVACNAKGELKLEEVPAFDGQLQGDLTVSGTGQFAGEVTAGSGSTFYGVVGITGGGDANDYAAFYGACLDPSGRVFIGSDVSGGGNNITSKIFASGNAEFSGDVVVNGTVKSNTYDSGVGYSLYRGDDWGGIYFKAVSSSGLSSDAAYPLRASFDGAENVVIRSSGKAYFAGDVVIGSRGKKWMIVESNGLAHLVEQTLLIDRETADLAGKTQYPPLRDIPGELTMVEEQLQRVLEKLRMVPEAGWEVWDGSDNI